MIIDFINGIIDYIYIFRIPLLLLVDIIFIFLKKRFLALLCFCIIILIVFFDFISPEFITANISSQCVNNFVSTCQNISTENMESKIQTLSDKYNVTEYMSYKEGFDLVTQLDVEPSKMRVYDFPTEDIPCAIVVSSVFHYKNVFFSLFDNEYYSATLYIIIDKYVIDISLFEARKSQLKIENQIEIFLMRF